MFLRASIAAVFAVASIAAAQAATVSSVEGQGSVNRGGGYQPVQVGAELQAGDRVLAGQGSSVTISFSPTCAVTVLPGESYRVPADPQCEAAYVEAGSGELTQGQMLGIGLGIGAAAIGIGAIIANASSDNDGSAFPRNNGRNNNEDDNNEEQCDVEYDVCSVSK